jgi:hypothetical protein
MKSNWVSAFLVATFLVGCGKDSLQKLAPALEDPTLSSVSEITGAESRRALIGRKITLDNTLVTAVVGDVTFWVGEPNNTALVVKGSELRTGQEGLRIRAGHRYRISGVIRLVENVDRTDPTWKMVDDREWAAIQNAQVYIESMSIVPMQ